jgi:hypothetical protein
MITQTNHHGVDYREVQFIDIVRSIAAKHGGRAIIDMSTGCIDIDIEDEDALKACAKELAENDTIKQWSV